MGSWNGSDFLTGLAIRWQDPVKCVLLLETEWIKDLCGGSYCHTSDVWHPWMLPISGQYNEGGCIEKIKMTPFLIQMEKDIIKAINKGDIIINKEKKWDFKNENLEDFLKAVERGVVTKKRQYNDKGGPIKVGYILVHDDVWTESVNTMKNNVSEWFYRCSDHKEATGAECYADMLSKLKEVYEQENTNPMRPRIFFSLYQAIQNTLFREDSTGWNSLYVEDYLVEHLEELIDDVIEMKLFLDFVSFSRKIFCPPSGGGSQYTNWEIMEKFYTNIAKLAHNKQVAWDERCQG